MKVFNCSSLLFMGVMFCSCSVKATLKTSFVEDICLYKNSFTFDLRYQKTGILMSLPPIHPYKGFECTITFLPRTGYSVVLSLFRYNLMPEDTLIIEDSDFHKVALIDWADFANEKKSILSEGKATIYYRVNSTQLMHSRRGFQLTFTEIHDAPCARGEFPCRNGKCIDATLLCKGHNHCGDNSDNTQCVPKDMKRENTPTPENKARYFWVIGIGIAAAVVLIVIIVFTVLLSRRRVNKKANPEAITTTADNKSNVPSVSAGVSDTGSPSEVEFGRPLPANASILNQIRRSFRALKGSKTKEISMQQMKPEPYQVPSMYPNLDQAPSAPSMEGIDNHEFRIEE